MTTKEKIAVMQAFDEGKPIEFKTVSQDDTYWRIIENPKWDWLSWDYRVKPQLNLRPYKSAKEFLEAQKEHGPYFYSGAAQYYIPKMILY